MSREKLSESSKMEGDELHNGGIFDKDQRKSNLVRELPDFDERRPNAYAGSSS